MQGANPLPGKLAPWPKGVNQVADLMQLPPGYLREAVNVTLDNAGVPKRRLGCSRLISGDVHSLWGNAQWLLAVVDGDLVSVTTETWETTVLRAGLGANPLSYAQVSNILYYTNGADHGRLDLTDLSHYRNWSPPHPAKAPTLLAETGGSLPAGTYQVALTYTSALGEESGATATATLELTGTQALHLTDIPYDADAYRVRVYCTLANGEALYRQAELAMGESELLLTSLTRGRELPTQFLEPLPADGHLMYYRGRLYVAAGAVLYYSNAIHYGLYAPDDNYLLFPADITSAVPVEDGFYVGADSTWFVQGTGPEDFVLRRLGDAPAIPGTELTIPAEMINPQLTGLAAYWLTAKGACIALPGGVLSYPTLNTLSGVTASSGVSGLLRDGGVDRVVTTLVT